MELKDQVCSPEPAKKLKDLGVKQDSVFAWFDGKVVAHSKQHPVREYGGASCSAFTVAELGEMLPLYLAEDANRGISFSVETQGLHIHKTYDNKGWVVNYSYRSRSSDTLANALAEMLIYLIENNLLPTNTH